MSQKKILKAQQSSPEPQVVVATIDVDTPPRQQSPEVKKTPEVQQKQPEVVASTSSASTSQAATRYVYRVEEYYHRRCFHYLTMFFLKEGIAKICKKIISLIILLRADKERAKSTAELAVQE